MRLSELKTGERAVVSQVYGKGSFRSRIIEMGFVKGSRIKVIMNAPLRDPIEYEIIGYRVSLRREEAALIEVVKEEEFSSGDNASSLFLEGIESEDRKIIPEKHHKVRVALVGNPNCGKTSLFNIASGSNEHVGNYSGVTVDSKEGYFKYKEYDFTLVDLPGTYSLSAYSPEELYVRRSILEEVPDIVLNVVDASNLERNLYLTSQLIDMDVRVVMALNMYDELLDKGDLLDIRQLGHLLGIPIVSTNGKSGKGIDKLFDTIIEVYENNDPSVARHIHINHGKDIETSITRLQELFRENSSLSLKYSTRYLAIKYLEGDSSVEHIVNSLPNYEHLVAARLDEQNKINEVLGITSSDAIVEAKYAFIQGALAETYVRKAKKPRFRSSLTDKIDAFITNKYLAFPIFILILYGIFAATFSIGQYPMDWINWLVEKFGDFVALNMSDGMLKDLVVDGIIAGVGSVLVFLPNILILYLFISLLEDSGYMARAAFIMDRIMHKMGLHGKSFIPMIMGFGCNVPAILATRMIENRRSRLITIFILPFMSCSGRLPVFVLLVGAFFPEHAAIVLLGLYLIGILLSVVTAKILSYFIKDDNLPFVMELPPYRVPTGKSVFRHTWEKGRQYLHKMGGVILVASVIIWALGYFPSHGKYETREQEQEHSYIGYVGKAMEPVLKPLGLDWRVGVGIVAGVGAKELVVSSMGVMYGIDDAGDGESSETRLQASLQRTMTPAAALGFMVFVLLYFPCVATFVAVKNETGTWKWPIYCAIYTIVVAWIIAFAVFRISGLFGLNVLM